MRIDPEFGTLSLNKFGAKYYIDAQCIYLPFLMSEKDGVAQRATLIHELVHFYQCLSTPFGLYKSILQTLRVILIREYLRAMLKDFSLSIWLPINLWLEDVQEIERRATPLSMMIRDVSIIDASLSAFDPAFLLGSYASPRTRYEIIQSTYKRYFPFQDYLISQEGSEWLYPAPQAYTHNDSILEGQALLWEIAFRSNSFLFPSLKSFKDEISQIASQDKTVFGTSVYTRSFEIAEEYLESDTFPLYSFMCELALFGEVPHINGWPPRSNYGRCGKGGTIPYEKVNPGSRFEDIFFFFQNKGLYVHKDVSAFEARDIKRISQIVDEICEFYEWKHPRKIIDEEIIMVKTLLGYFSRQPKDIQQRYRALTDMLLVAMQLLKQRKDNLLLLTFPSDLLYKQKPFIFYRDGPESGGNETNFAVGRLVDAALTKMFYPSFEHAAREREDMQSAYYCPARSNIPLTFFCPKLGCDGFNECGFHHYLVEQWGTKGQPISIIGGEQ